MARRLLFLLLLVLLIAPTTVGAQPGQLPVDLPREEVFVADQIFRYSVLDNFNFWVNGPHTPHRHALISETLWYADQETGERLYGAAKSDPIYNDDFTQMTVELRDNLYWSDGVHFTADDLVYTIETLIANPGLNAGGWSSVLTQFVDSVEKVDDFTVRFNLAEANPRFHFYFETRWNGVYIMPKHVFETVEDPTTFTFSPPVTLGAYTVTQTDPNGYWELFTRRDDWDRTSGGIVTGKPGPKYVLTIFYGDSARKVIAMSRGELDVFFDVDFEAFETVLETTTTARSWYVDFPWAYPNELNSRMFTFNYEADPVFQNKDVRWALALSLDIVDLQTEYIGGVAQVSVLPGMPTTPKMRGLYYDPLEEWLQNLEIEIEPGEMFQPYDPTVPDRIAEWAEAQGYNVPGEPRDVFGSGWWKFAPDVAERLLVKNGFSRDGSGRWIKPDGQPFAFSINAAPDEPDAFRMSTAAQDMWGDFGIDVDLQAVERSVYDQNNYVGQFQVAAPWTSFADPTGDIWQTIRTLDSALHVPAPEDFRSRGASNIIASMRLQDPVTDEFIARLGAADPQAAETVVIAQDFLKHWTENMFFIQVISFKKFVTWDERYWTGFPTSEEPTIMPLYWFMGGKFTFQGLEPIS
jgi:peptide/nickel transport system substrate-binding protein